MSERKRYDKIPIQGNVYPVPSLIYINDQLSQLTRFNLLTGQPLGATSPKSGSIDIFMDRKLLQDDNRGLGQGVQDNLRTKLQFKLLFEPVPREAIKPSNDVQTELISLNNPVILMESNSVDGQNINFMASELTSFPCDVHLVNLRTSTRTDDQSGQVYHMTLHRFGTSCETKKCSSSIVNLSKLMSNSIISNIKSQLSQVSLSFLKIIRNYINVNEDLIIDPMDIVVYAIEGVNYN